MNLSINALVLSAVDYGEKDKILTLFSPKMGKVTARARGCQSSKSKLLASSQVFTYGRYELSASKNNRFYITACKIEESHFGIMNDILAFAAGSHILYLTNQIIQEDESYNELFKSILLILKQLAIHGDKAHQLLLYYELYIIKHEGLMPNLDGCKVCNKTNNLMLCALDGILVCNNCTEEGKHYIDISQSVITTLSYMLVMDIRSIYIRNETSCDRRDASHIMGDYRISFTVEY